MPAATVKDTQDLPAILKMSDIQNVLGLSKTKTYELTSAQGFPVVRFGRAIRVPRDAFLRWLHDQAGGQEEG